LSALAADALTGLDVGYAGDALRPLAGGLAELGARIAAGDAPIDLLLVSVDGSPSTDGRASSFAGAAPSLDGAADGTSANALTAAFSSARDGASRLRPGGSLIFVLSPADDVIRAAVASLTRTLALEWGPDARVNALACAEPNDAVELAALVAWRASRTLTGGVLECPGRLMGALAGCDPHEAPRT
jgi:hypothetical protein